VAIIGPNGAGKSTLLRLIMGKENPNKGRVSVGGAGGGGYGGGGGGERGAGHKHTGGVHVMCVLFDWWGFPNIAVGCVPQQQQSCDQPELVFIGEGSSIGPLFPVNVSKSPTSQQVADPQQQHCCVLLGNNDPKPYGCFCPSWAHQ
jgi:energy-coupling factor transporter ATP-binding protein EcfA2